jgi:hypothetical protein
MHLIGEQLNFRGIPHSVIRHIRSIDANEEAYVVVALECSNNHRQVSIDIFISNLVLSDNFEVGINHRH